MITSEWLKWMIVDDGLQAHWSPFPIIQIRYNYDIQSQKVRFLNWTEVCFISTSQMGWNRLNYSEFLNDELEWKQKQIHRDKKKNFVFSTLAGSLYQKKTINTM